MALYEIQMRQRVVRHQRVTVEALSEEHAKRRAAEMAKGFVFASDLGDEEELGEWETADQGRVVFDRVTERVSLITRRQKWIKVARKCPRCHAEHYHHVEAPVPVPYRATINCAACGHRWKGRITREEGGR